MLPLPWRQPMLQPLLVDGIEVLLLVTVGPCLGHPLQELVHAEWGGAAAGHAWDVRQVTWQVEGQGMASASAQVRCLVHPSGRRKSRGAMAALEDSNCCLPRLESGAGHQAKAAISKVCRLAEDTVPSGRGRQRTGLAPLY